MFTDAYSSSAVFRYSAVAPVTTYTEPARRKVIIKLDSRETRNKPLLESLRKKLGALGLVVDNVLKIVQLELFDVVLCIIDGDSDMLAMGIERKTAADLAASIKDGRYREQKGRMNELDLPASHKLMLVEGNLLDKNYGINTKSLLGAVVGPCVREEGDTIMTRNMEASADIIIEMYRYIEHMDIKPHVRKTYIDFKKANIRKSDICTENRLGLMLAEHVNGVSASAAKVITDKYATMAVLQHAFIVNKDATLNTIANLKHRTDNGVCAVGRSNANKICEFFEIDKLHGLLTTEKTVPRLRKKKKGDNDDDDDDDDIIEEDSDYEYVETVKPPKLAPARGYGLTIAQQVTKTATFKRKTGTSNKKQTPVVDLTNVFFNSIPIDAVHDNTNANNNNNIGHASIATGSPVGNGVTDNDYHIVLDSIDDDDLLNWAM